MRRNYFSFHFFLLVEVFGKNKLFVSNLKEAAKLLYGPGFNPFAEMEFVLSAA